MLAFRSTCRLGLGIGRSFDRSIRILPRHELRSLSVIRFPFSSQQCITSDRPKSRIAAPSEPERKLYDSFPVVSYVRSLGWNVMFAARCVIRALFLAVLFAPTIISFPVIFIVDSFRSSWFQLLVNTLEVSGPTFVKLGQWASTRPDVFPDELCRVLSKLHDQVTPHSFEQTRKIIRTSFGRELDELFDEFDCNPIGSGCIAQVHVARLIGDKRHVAVKVRHPSIMWLIQSDLAIMKFVADVLDIVPTMKWLSLPEEVEQFSIIMKNQLDLRVEADNLMRFTQNFEGFEGTVFPQPGTFEEKVLIEQYYDAVPMRYFINGENATLKAEIADLGLKSFLKMMLEDNFIHSDLHPGNILVEMERDGDVYPSDKLLINDRLNEVELLKATASGYKPRLVLLDAGLVTELTDENLTNFLDLFTAVAEGNGAEVARLMVERSRLPPVRKRFGVPSPAYTEKCRDFFGFESKMRVIISQVQQDTFRLANIYIGDVLGSVLSLVREHHVKIESDFTNLVVSIIVLEGLGRQLDPDVDLFEAAKPFLRFRKTNFYTSKGGLFLKFAAFLEARSLLRRHEDPEMYDNMNIVMLYE